MTYLEATMLLSRTFGEQANDILQAIRQDAHKQSRNEALLDVQRCLDTLRHD